MFHHPLISVANMAQKKATCHLKIPLVVQNQWKKDMSWISQAIQMALKMMKIKQGRASCKNLHKNTFLVVFFLPSNRILKVLKKILGMTHKHSNNIILGPNKLFYACYAMQKENMSY